MKKFRIHADSVQVYYIDIEANSLEEAQDKAQQEDAGNYHPLNDGDWNQRNDLDYELGTVKADTIKKGDVIKYQDQTFNVTDVKKDNIVTINFDDGQVLVLSQNDTVEKLRVK